MESVVLKHYVVHRRDVISGAVAAGYIDVLAENQADALEQAKAQCGWNENTQWLVAEKGGV